MILLSLDVSLVALVLFVASSVEFDRVALEIGYMVLLLLHMLQA